MKRRDSILLASLALFNEVGESNVSSVDIANELDISPGNLYYHFKGKERIVEALVDQFRSQLSAVIASITDADIQLPVRWPLVYLIAETLYANRFLLRNINDLVHRYPRAGESVVNLLNGLRQYLVNMLTELAAGGEIGLEEEQKNLIAKLAKNMMLVFIYSDSYRILEGRPLSGGEYVQDLSLQVLSLLAPYLEDDQIRELHRIHQAYLRERALKSGG